MYFFFISSNWVTAGKNDKKQTLSALWEGLTISTQCSVSLQAHQQDKMYTVAMPKPFVEISIGMQALMTWQSKEGKSLVSAYKNLHGSTQNPYEAKIERISGISCSWR